MGAFISKSCFFGFSAAPLFWFSGDVVAGDLSCRRPRPLDSSLFLEVGPADSGQGADFRGGPLRRSGGCVGFILCILAPIRNSDFACSSFFKGVPMSSPGDPGLATSCCSTLGHNPRLCMRGIVKNLFLSSLLVTCPFQSLRHRLLRISFPDWPPPGSWLYPP